MDDLAHIDTVIFDAEGVVIDTESLWDDAQRDFLRRFGKTYDRAMIKPLLAGRTMLDGARVLKEELGLPGAPEELAAARIDSARRLFDEVKFIRGFRAFFDAVAPRFKTCIATSMYPELFWDVADYLDLRSLFEDRMFNINDVGGRGKPAPDLFLFAASALGSGPQSCVVIEDAPNGVEAAHNAEMPCIGLTTTFEPSILREADLVVSSFDEIDVAALAQFRRTPHDETS
jgi:beta-phosphoglucomutase